MVIQNATIRYSISDYKMYQKYRQSIINAGNPTAPRRRRRGKPSASKLLQKELRGGMSIEDSKEWRRRVVHHTTKEANPFQFYNKKPSKDDIQTAVASTTVPLIRVSEDNWWMVPTDNVTEYTTWARKTSKKTTDLENWGMKYLAIRSCQNLFGGALLSRVNALLIHVLDGNIHHSGIKARIAKNDSRNTYPPKHLGYRCHYGGDGPDGIGLWSDCTTQDPDSEAVKPKTDAIKRLLAEIQRSVAPILLHHMKQLDPDVFQFQQLIRQRLLALRPAIPKEWPVDFGGPFFAMSIAKGSSERVHVDGTDFGKAYAIVVPTSTFSGADFVLPTLGIQIPVRAGQFLAVAASFLPHYVMATTSGERYALTFFTDEYAAAKVRDIMVDMGFTITQLNF